MSLQTGARIGPYEVVAPIGAGGMGEVYRARDTKLGRDHVGRHAQPRSVLVEGIGGTDSGSVFATVTDWFEELRRRAPAKK